MLPQLLGYIFHIIHQVLQRFGEVRLKELPRMADWCEIGELVARVLGYKPMEFVNAYFENLNLTSSEALDASPIALALMSFMENKPAWVGLATRLLDELNEHEKALGHTYVITGRNWPKSANALSRKIDEIKTNLRDIGIIIHRDKNHHLNVFEYTIVNQSLKIPSDSDSDDDRDIADDIDDNNGSNNNKTDQQQQPPKDGLFGFDDNNNNNNVDDDIDEKEEAG
jgi:hypothetical protein